MEKLFFDLQRFAEGESGTGEGGGEGQNGGEKGGEGKKEGEGTPGKKEGETGQEKTFTQADIDKMIKERLQRETKKHEKALEELKKSIMGESAGEGKGTGEGAANKEETVKAQQVLATANQRLVAATATAEAVKLGVDPKYTADVVRLADLSKVEVKEDGTVDDSAVSKAVDEVLKRVPVFKAQQEGQGGFKVGGEGQQSKGQTGWGQQQVQGKKPWNKNQ